ncbi:fructose-6-phosphate aldolase [candidate division KSB1 bacterium]
MKFFLDTANVDDIREAASIGIVDGVTTNPSLLSKEQGKGTFKEILKEICSIVDGPISGEVVGEDWEGMVKEGDELSKIAPNMVVKIPMTKEGMKAVKHLTKQGIRTNVTLIFNPAQALIAAKAGASFVSPFIGRLDDISQIGMDIIRDIVEIYENYDIETEVITASVRSPLHVVDAALAGSHIATVPFAVIEKLFKHPLTDAGIQQFLEDWKKVDK